MKLHRRLITELIGHRLAAPKDFNFVPHVTLLYNRFSIPEQPVSPIRWPMSEVALVLSHIGKTHYDRLQSWTLES